ncbi:hypothetical protein SAMN06296241_0859 [Salinimicrobium sediminis]|uniref:Uncharacterized protein n=1 Tax=Salinimicrobium sediminis TaxID=1343891 RepID=A0A285X209_9FLAO|nr:hypothetical protein SAMN06296241_0859 [Salinimicrobium sediminis]
MTDWRLYSNVIVNVKIYQEFRCQFNNVIDYTNLNNYIKKTNFLIDKINNLLTFRLFPIEFLSKARIIKKLFGRIEKILPHFYGSQYKELALWEISIKNVMNGPNGTNINHDAYCSKVLSHKK